MTEIEQILTKLVDDLRAENNALLEIVFESQGLLPKETPAVSDTQSVGKIPWYMRKARLERLFQRKEIKDASEE